MFANDVVCIQTILVAKQTKNSVTKAKKMLCMWSIAFLTFFYSLFFCQAKQRKNHTFQITSDLFAYTNAHKCTQNAISCFNIKAENV